MLNKIIKYGLYLLVFLIPIFFLPLTVWPVALNKQMLLAGFCLFLLVLWLIKIFVSGKFSFVWNKLVVSALLLLFVLALSTLFSGSRAQSFWGMAFEPDTFFNFLLYVLVFLLFTNTLINADGKQINADTQISKAILAFLASSGVLALLFLIQLLLQRPLFSWDFANFLTFNPVGTSQALALFLGGAFVVFLSLIKIGPVPIFAIFGILLFASIFLINYWLVWLLVALGLVIIMAEMAKTIGKSFGPKELKRFGLPLCLLVLALLFIFIRVPTQNIINILPEVSLTYKATFNIALKTLQESPKNFLLGSGPASFGYQHSLHRSAGPNLTDFWQFRFSQGAAALPTFLATWGVPGALVILLLIGIFFFQGLKPIYLGRTSVDGTQLATLVGATYFFLTWFFYPLNFVLAFASFLMLGLWMANQQTVGRPTSDKDQNKSVVKEFSFSESPQKAFFTMMICVILIVASLVGIYKIFQNYRAALAYSQGLKLVNAAEPKLDQAIQKLNQAALLDRKDVYFRNLSGAFLLKMNEVLDNQELSQEEKQKAFQQVVSNAELSATAAVQINPMNSQNWLHLGNVYENLASFDIEGTIPLAISNYQKTQELDPQNPQIPLNMGRVYKTKAERDKIRIAILEQMEEKDEEQIKQLEESANQNLDLALGHFEKSRELKPNFSAAYYLMAQAYEMADNKDEALKNYQIVLQLEPGNEEVKARVEELSK